MLSDERARGYICCNTYFMLGLLILYYYIVQDLGPKLMKHKKPFNLEKVLIGFNIIQIIACIYVEYQVRTMFFN